MTYQQAVDRLRTSLSRTASGALKHWPESAAEMRRIIQLSDEEMIANVVFRKHSATVADGHGIYNFGSKSIALLRPTQKATSELDISFASADSFWS